VRAQATALAVSAVAAYQLVHIGCIARMDGVDGANEPLSAHAVATTAATTAAGANLDEPGTGSHSEMDAAGDRHQRLSSLQEENAQLRQQITEMQQVAKDAEAQLVKRQAELEAREFQVCAPCLQSIKG
jgi:TolA-binding protein